MVPKQLVCETYNLLVDSAILSGCVKALVCVILTLAALVLLGVGAGVHFDVRWEVRLWEYGLGK
jgi:hypothetical protein